MNATKPNKSISAKKDTGECFSTKLKSSCKNLGTFEGKNILPEKVTYIPLAPSHSILKKVLINTNTKMCILITFLCKVNIPK